VIGIRVNPQIGAGAIAMSSTATATSKFGIGLVDDRERVVQRYLQHAFLSGVHVHVGSQGCTIALLIAGCKAVLDLAKEIDRRRLAVGMAPLKYIDIGGGLSVDYGFDPNESEPRAITVLPDFDGYARAILEEVPALTRSDLIVFTEFGRAVSAKCGFALSKVEHVKETGGRKMAVVHCGADMFVRTALLPNVWRHRIEVFDAQGKRKEGDRSKVDVVGPLCFTGDVIGHQRLLPSIAVGDLVAVHDAGAYTLSMWSTYNTRLVRLSPSLPASSSSS